MFATAAPPSPLFLCSYVWSEFETSHFEALFFSGKTFSWLWTLMSYFVLYFLNLMFFKSIEFIRMASIQRGACPSSQTSLEIRRSFGAVLKDLCGQGRYTASVASDKKMWMNLRNNSGELLVWSGLHCYIQMLSSTEMKSTFSVSDPPQIFFYQMKWPLLRNAFSLASIHGHVTSIDEAAVFLSQ